MGFFSILPANLTWIETWLARAFLILAIITLGPWVLALVYDLVLYLWRFAASEIQGGQRPAAPSLTERPNGHRRNISFVSQYLGEHNDSAITTGADHRSEDSAP